MSDLEELRDPDAPELVHVARADAVRVCRVAELVRVNGDAKQKSGEETKTQCRFVATNKEPRNQITPLGVFLCFDLVVCARAYCETVCRVAELVRVNTQLRKQDPNHKDESVSRVFVSSFVG
jgi:hypothetical protein